MAWSFRRSLHVVWIYFHSYWISPTSLILFSLFLKKIMEKCCAFALWWIIIFLREILIFRSFLPFFLVFWMLQECNYLYIYFAFQKYCWNTFLPSDFFFQFCFGCANIELRIWPETKPLCSQPFRFWMKQKAPSMPLPLHFCLNPFAWPVLHFSCFVKCYSHNLEISSTKWFFSKSHLEAVSKALVEIYGFTTVWKRSKCLAWQEFFIIVLLIKHFLFLFFFFFQMITNCFKIFSDLSNWIIFIQSNNDIFMVLVNCPRIIGEKTCKFLIIARKLVWFFFYLPTGLNTST